jgi:3',5'-cyclic AMP phosphodiesterase CpdA
MAAFVLAHLSDPHLAPLPKPRFAELLGKRVTGYINWRRKREAIHRPEVLARIVADLKAQAPDHIAVTGDLVNLALPDEYPPARTWLEALGPPHDVTLVPGNHDAYVRTATSYRALHWSPYMRGDGVADTGDVVFPFLRRRGPLALIGVSSAVPSLPFMATGRVGSWQLDQLAQLLHACRQEGLFRVVIIHHPPTTRRSDYFKRLVDAPLLRDTLARHGAELVIHGHNHRRQTVWLDGPSTRIPAIAVPSASEAPPGEHDPAGYNLYRIEGEPGAWRCEVVARAISGDSIVEIRRQTLA